MRGVRGQLRSLRSLCWRPHTRPASARALPPALALTHTGATVRRADKKFVNKMSRVIIACQDGGRRSEIAAEMVTGMGYTAIATIEGGVEAYLKVSPLKEADLRPRVKRVQQEVGIKYGGTGVTSEQTPGASRRCGGPTPRVGACATLVLTHAAARARQTTARKRLSTDCSAVIEGRGGVHDGPYSGFAGSCRRVLLCFALLLESGRPDATAFGFICQHLLGERAQLVCPCAPHQAQHEPLGHRNRMRDPRGSLKPAAVGALHRLRSSASGNRAPPLPVVVAVSVGCWLCRRSPRWQRCASEGA